MKPLKAIKSLISGLLATVSPKNFADCGVKVDVSPDDDRAPDDKLLVEAHGIMTKAAATIVSLEKKLTAATDALMQIECLTQGARSTESVMKHTGVKTELICKANILSQDARRATQA
jgi:phosphoribosylformylglycinamidine (FGAM) synthase-like enzyme